MPGLQQLTVQTRLVLQPLGLAKQYSREDHKVEHKALEPAIHGPPLQPSTNNHLVPIALLNRKDDQSALEDPIRRTEGSGEAAFTCLETQRSPGPRLDVEGLPQELLIAQPQKYPSKYLDYLLENCFSDVVRWCLLAHDKNLELRSFVIEWVMYQSSQN